MRAEKPMATADREVRRVLHALRSLVRVHEVSIRELERRAGVGQGVFRRLLAGERELTLRHLYKILEILSTSPSRFFQLVHAQPTPSPEEATGLLEQMRRLGLATDSPARSEAVSDDDIDRRIQEAIRRRQASRRHPTATSLADEPPQEAGPDAKAPRAPRRKDKR
jgi:transcriptional regulator with XRE-family HTH domain